MTITIISTTLLDDELIVENRLTRWKTGWTYYYYSTTTIIIISTIVGAVVDGLEVKTTVGTAVDGLQLGTTEGAAIDVLEVYATIGATVDGLEVGTTSLWKSIFRLNIFEVHLDASSIL